MTSDQMQQFCFLVCYNSIRTRGVLAIPSPVRYADLCAYRSKLHVEAQRDLIDVASKSSEENTEKIEQIEIEIIRRLNEIVKVNDKVKDRLYYC